MTHLLAFVFVKSTHFVFITVCLLNNVKIQSFFFFFFFFLNITLVYLLSLGFAYLVV